MKRITSSLLALLLALSMLIGMVPAAYAAPADTIESIDSTETVDSSETEDVSDESEDVAAYAADTELTDYVVVKGINGFEGKKYASFADAYAEIKPEIEKLASSDELGQGGATSAEAFKKFFTDVDKNGNATLTYEITGNVVYDEANCKYLLTMGRHSSHYNNGEPLHLINFKFVGQTENRGATLTVNSDITLPYEWWGEKVTTSISFENLTITGSAPNGLDATQPYFEGIDFTINNCTLRGIKVYNCSNVGGKYTITNSTLNGTGAPVDAYAIHLQGNESAPLAIKIDNNQISGYDRGINIDQNTAVAEINNNEISVKDKGRSCIQLSRLAKTTVSGNELALTGGNAITLHKLLLETGAVPEITVTGNNITGSGYLIYDDAVANGEAFTSKNLNFTFDNTNTVASTVDKKTGVKGSDTHNLSEIVDNKVNGSSTTGVAMVGTTTYNTLEEAISALSSTGYTLKLLDESAWNTATPVYWEAGEQRNYAATLTDALTAAYKVGADNIKIVCRPGADVGTMTHGHVADNITIYGNNAYISGGECELEVDTYKFSRETGAQDTTNGVYLDKDIVINAYELDNLGVWGERHTTHTVNVNLTDCDGKALEKNVQRVYISGTTGKNEITLKNCDFITAATAVYSNADGQISIDTCSFTGSKVPVNFNHKANGEQRLTVSNSTFKNCGDNGEWNQFAAPVRFVNSGSGTQSATVDTCTFAGTVGSNGDILIGDGRTGQESNDVSLTVMNTDATVKAQKPGYYDGTATDTSKGAETTVESSKTLNTSVEEMLPTALTAYVTVNGGTEQYATLDEAIAAAEPENGVITYTVTGKVNANGESWIQVAKAGLTGLTEVKFVGADANAEICITNSTAVLADQSYDIDVSFKDLTLSHPNGAWVSDLGHATNYFTTVLRNTDAANNTVSYTNCTFPNGACNNQYGKTVYANCKFTNATSGKYNLWNYGGNTEIKNSTFTGTRGIKTYNEGTLAVAPTVKIEGTTFNGLTEKAAVVASKATDITFDNVTTMDCEKGTFEKDIENSGETTTITANGSGISGSFTITAEKGEEAAKDEFNISAGTFNSEVSSDYCADGFEVKANENGTYGVVQSTQTTKGTRENPYTLDDLSNMTRAEYIAAQERLGGTMYVTVGDYNYETNGTLGNGTADNSDRDSTKMNYYGAPGAKEGQYSDAAVGKNIVFVGGNITSGVTGYKDVDNPGTSLLLAVPAYTNVTFEGTTFKNVMSFNYQLYTSPWSQLGELKFDGCTFNGIIVGAIAAQTLTFNNCNFGNYTNTYAENGKNVGANNSNPIWVRPAYGNWTKGDNEGQGGDFKSLTTINFTGNTVTSTRPVKFERIAQWEMDTTVTATGNTFTISKQDGETSTKNVGLYFGANAKFDLVVEGNTKNGSTAALYTAVYSAPNGGQYAGLPAGSTVTNVAGEKVELDALEWKSDNKLTLKTTEEVASVTNAKGTVVNFASLSDAIAAAADGDTVTLLADTTEDVVISKNITLDLGGKTLTNTNAGKATISVTGGTVTVKNGNVVGGTSYYNIEVTKGSNANLTLEGVTATAGNTGSSMIDNYGTLTVTSGTYTGGLDTVKNEPNATLTINGGTFTLTKGTSKGFTGVVFNYGKLTITGGEFTQSDKNAPYGQAQVIHTDKSGSAVPSTTITGGTFKNLCTGSTTAWVVRESNAADGATKVSGGTFNKDVKPYYCADGYIPTKNADGTYGVKEGKYVAQIGSKYYETLADAIRLAAKGKTITLLANVKESVEISKNLTLDLNGFTLTNEGAKHTITVNEGVSLTIEDSVGTGTVDNVTHGRGALVNNGTVILSGGTFERSAEKGKFEPYGNGGNSWYTIANYGTMTINNKTTVKNAGGYSSNILNGDKTTTSTLTIEGGTFEGGINTVKNGDCGVLEIKGGELKNTAQYVIMNWHKATISGGTFETAKTADAVLFSSKYDENAEVDLGELTITGGKFTAAEGAKLIDDSYGEYLGTVKIRGGSFNLAVDPKHCDTGFIPTQNADGTYGVKEGTYVAKVDNVKYETLQAAINAAKGGSTVRLLANVTLTETAVFPAGKTVHLNLVGHNITATGTALLINGRTDIQSTDSNGVIESTGNVAVAVGNNASLTVYSGTLKGREGAVITGTSTGAKIEIRTAKPTLIATDNAVIAGNGSKRDGNPNTILVKGGTFIGGIVSEGYIACGIYAPWNDNVTVSGGTFNITNGAGIVARAGNVKVTGGTFKCGDGQTTGWVGDSKNKVPNAALVFDKAANYPALTESSQILVSGGTFSTDPAANGAKLADGYVATQTDGMYKVGKAEPVAEINGDKYDTLQAAINAAQAKEGGATITLLKNINTESYYMVNGDNPVTIDLAGHNITGSGISGLFYVTAKGDLTIKGEGTVTAVEDTGAAMAVWVRSPSAKVTLEGGTYTQQITNTADPHFDLIYVERGNVYVKGGTYKGLTPDWTLNCKDEYYLSKEANIEVTGGTFYGFDPGANPEGEGTTYVKTGYVSTKNADGTYGVKEGTYVAAIGEKKYATLKEAVDAAQNGDTITLLADVEQNTMLVIKKDITLDLAGKKIFNTTDIWSDANGSYELLSIEAKVTITGNGTIDAKENDCYTINVKNGDLTIENGTFYGNISVVQVEKGTLTINGGKFDLHQKWKDKNTYLINCIDDAFVAKTAKVAIYGGEFVDFDPNVSPEKKIDGKTPSFAAPGVGITKNENNTFTAKPNMVAQIVDADGSSVAAYATLKEAVNAAQNGETVIVLTDATVEERITAEANITIDLNQKTVTVADGADTMLKTTGDVTIKNGTLKSDVTANIINVYGKLKLESVKIYGSTVDGYNLVNVLGNAEVTIDAASEIVADGVGVAVFVGEESAAKDAKYTLNIYGKVTQKCKSYAISGNGSYPGTSYINIYEGAEVTANHIADKMDCCAIYQPQAGEINVYGGLVEGYCAIVMKSGTLNISGGTVRGIRNDNVLGDNNSAGNGASYDGSAIVVDSRKTGYAGNVKINVTGGTVESYYSTAIREIGNDSSMTQLVELTVTGGEIRGASKNLTNAENDILVRDISVSNVAISGGTFNHEVQADYCAVGYEPSEKDASGMYTVQKVSGNAYYVDNNGKPVYGDFAALVASTNAATKGKTITLLKNVKIEDNLVLFGNRTVDLNGNVLEITEIFIGLYGKVIDSSDGNGLLKIAADNVTLQSDNGLLPIYDSAKGGYRLFNVQMKGMTEGKGNGVVVKLMPSFTNKDAYKLMKVGSTNNITFAVTISWMSENGPASQEFTFDQSLVNRVAESWMNGKYGYFIITLTGLDSDVVGSIKDIKAQGSIKSGTGARIDSIYYDIPQN